MHGTAVVRNGAVLDNLGSFNLGDLDTWQGSYRAGRSCQITVTSA